MLANAFDFVTLILWIPSTHKIFENPNKKKAVDQDEDSGTLKIR